MKSVYLDNASTTPVDSEVVSEMMPYFSEQYGNPRSFHSKGLESNNTLNKSRKSIAKILNCESDEIIFTSGGTESINLALKGVAFSLKSKGNHIITSKIEHPAVLNTCKFLEKNGFNITYLDTDKYGKVSLENLENAITNKTILISIMYANNEIGTIEPVAEIGKIANSHQILFHTDACQAAGALNLDTKSLNVDLLTLNGSKINGPKGSGILYKKNGVEIEPLIHGGGQEFGLRSGTENVPAIVGFATALKKAQKEKDKENKRLIKLRDYLISNLLKIPKTKLNGHPKERLPNNANISFIDVEGEAILLNLDKENIYASTGSACASKSLSPSHVLRAIGLPYEGSHGSIRFTLGRDTKKQDIEKVVSKMPKIIEKLRRISPVNLNMRHFT